MSAHVTVLLWVPQGLLWNLRCEPLRDSLDIHPAVAWKFEGINVSWGKLWPIGDGNQGIISVLPPCRGTVLIHGYCMALFNVVLWHQIISFPQYQAMGSLLLPPCWFFLLVFFVLLPTSLIMKFSSVQSLSRVQLFATSGTVACQASLSITSSQNLPKLMSIESVMPSNHLILCCPLLLLPSIFPSIRVFSNESALHIRWPKYWSFSFNISPSNEHPGLISFRMDWLDLLAV